MGTHNASRGRFSNAMRVALWFGLLTGLVEAFLLGVKRVYMHDFVRVGLDVVWMAPLADAALFAVVAVVVAAVARSSSRRAQILIFACSFLAFMSAFLMYYPLHLYAKLVLAAGLAVQSVRVLAGRMPQFDRLVRRTLPWVAAAVVLIAAGMTAWPAVALRQQIARLPAPPSGAPNVLLIVLDTVRAESMSLYGYSRATTPNLERWAARSVVFDRATSTAPWTLPSHASMFTGRWPLEQSSDWEVPLDDSHVTLAEALNELGYLTAGFVANGQYGGYEFGLNRGFRHYEDYIRSPQETAISSSLARALITSTSLRRLVGYYDTIGRQDAASVNSRFLKWVSRTEDRPFFAFLNYFDAHETYFPPAPFDRTFGSGESRDIEHVMHDVRRSMRTDWHRRPAAEIEAEMAMYDGTIAYMDAELNRLLTSLDERGLLDKTIVIVTSDHGEQFGEHGLFLHSNSLYKPLLHVPLMISYPARVPGGLRVGTRVSLHDLPSTVLDLIGMHDDDMFPGASLSRHWSAGSASTGSPDLVLSEVRYSDWAEKWHPTAKGDMHSLMDDRYHYIRTGDGREELYDLQADPGEQHDVGVTVEGRPVVERFRSQLEHALEARARGASKSLPAGRP
jgi:arylsulfatase A-like enzyme